MCGHGGPSYPAARLLGVVLEREANQRLCPWQLEVVSTMISIIALSYTFIHHAFVNLLWYTVQYYILYTLYSRFSTTLYIRLHYILNIQDDSACMINTLHVNTSHLF